MVNASLDLRAVSIAIITRHSADCAHKDDPQYKRCNCWKHLRYFDKVKGKMVWRATKQRTWVGAERFKYDFEHDHDPTRRDESAVARVTVREAIDTFIKEKEGQNLSGSILGKYRLELNRLHNYLEPANIFQLEDVTLPHLTGYRATWTTDYPHSMTRRMVQGRLKTFFKYATLAYNLRRSPAEGLAPVRAKSSPTLPYTPEEYQAILDAIPACSLLRIHSSY